MDLYMVTGTQAEALEYYKKKTGRPGRVNESVYRDGHAVMIVDRDPDGGAAYISQYKVGIQEVLDED